MVQRGLVSELGLDKFAVEAGDVGDRLVLRANGRSLRGQRMLMRLSTKPAPQGKSSV